jgi:hypothetical protein
MVACFIDILCITNNKSSTYTGIMQKPVLDFLMNTHGQSSLFEYPLFRRNFFSWLYHILPDCFKLYGDLTSFTQYMLRFAFIFGTEIPSWTFMYISESNEPYKYVVMAFINCKDRCFCIARDIKYQNIIPFITGEYVSLKSTSGLCVKPCAASLSLYLTTSFFCLFLTKPHLNPTGKVLGGVGITSMNTFLFLSELSSPSIASFHLF